MFFFKYNIAFLVISAYAHCNAVSRKSDRYSTTAVNPTPEEVEKVDVFVYYETLCPACINFFANHIEPIIPSMHGYVRLHLYPYGGAGTSEKDGKYVTSCHHGKAECRGNKLHACAFDILKNETESALYVSCMMAAYSDDSAANECGKAMNIDAAPITECAKSYKAELLLKHYSDLSSLTYYSVVPYIIINGKRSSQRHFERNVCKAFKYPPPPCKEYEEVTVKSTTEGITEAYTTEETSTISQ